MHSEGGRGRHKRTTAAHTSNQSNPLQSRHVTALPAGCVGALTARANANASAMRRNGATHTEAPKSTSGESIRKMDAKPMSARQLSSA